MANERLERFTKLLKEIFELDKSDLDFGIYRVMNLRKTQIEQFLTYRLPEMVQETLKPFAQGGKDKIRAQMQQIEENVAGMGMTIDTLPDNAPMKEKYNQLKKQFAEGADLAALETDVYSALYSFFNRYYEDGDFISKRRYKEGVYAIPYEGEEVKLYWANQDQYYIKTSENFKDYTFVCEGITVHFRLMDATTEQNNNKENADSKRKFMLFTEDEENYPGIKTFEYNPDAAEIVIRFVYDIPEDKKRKYDEENKTAIVAWLVSLNKPELYPLLAPISTGKGKETTTVLEKHLKGYVAKNTFDYFIHKDLRGFLTRELDFFIKSEIMHLEDLDTGSEARVETYLAKVKAVKRVGKIIIDFLAQIEDFQKKLWLKKKFVVETNWCITLDKIDESFWPEIIGNKGQIDEWITMYAINEAEGWTNPPTVDFLRANQNLIIDTKYFLNTFKYALLESIPDLDKQTIGLLINGDNYHAIRLLQKVYGNSIRCTYIDPPYNSPSSEVLYKNSYKHSAWLTLMHSRLVEGQRLQTEDGAVVIAIDKYEHNWLFDLCKELFPEDDVVSVAIEHNKKGTQGDHFSYSNEYAVFAVPMAMKTLNEVMRPESEWEYSAFRNWGSESERSDAANCFYPVFVQNGIVVGYGDVLPDDIHPEASNQTISGEIKCYVPGEQQTVTLVGSEDNPVIAVWPIDDEGIERKWRYAYQSIGEIYGFLKVERSRIGNYQIKMPKYSDQFKTLWADSRYNAGDYGTKVLTGMGFTKEDFEYPKSVYTVKDCVYAISRKDSIVFDYFAGSGTTAQAVMLLNKEDAGTRRFILVEMGTYFDRVTVPRVKKSMYGSGIKSWDNGKPSARNDSTCGVVRYQSLESYEDALSNIELSDNGGQLKALLGEDYLIHYMVDLESRSSLLDVEAFANPFAYTMKITEKNECKERPVDLVETFNYLIGLTVARQSALEYYLSKLAEKPAYEGAVDLVSDISGQYIFRQIEGTLPDGRRVLVIWRTVTEDLVASNAALDAYFTTYRKNADDRKYDVIFVNGDSNLENLRSNNENWKVEMTEIEFKKRMFEEM